MNFVEKRGGIFWPSTEMKRRAWIAEPGIYKTAGRNPVKFWEKLAGEGITWNKKWKKAYEEKLPYFKWFLGGRLNVSYNCLDRHIEAGMGSKTAIIFVPEPLNEKTRRISYNELYGKVNRCANLLLKLGVRKGDVVAIYMPLIPEAIISMLACARIGAIHSAVFSAFSAEALKTRLMDGGVEVLITADGYYRRGKPEDLKKKVDTAIRGTRVRKILLVSRTGSGGAIRGRKYVQWNEVERQPDYCEPCIMESNETLFVLYTSGTTGKPKGIVHDTGGYITQAYWTTKWDFDLHDDDIFWCVPPNTSVITNFNIEDISTIKENDQVLSHNGRFTKVLEVFQRPYKGNLIRFKLNYFSEPILITPNHKILISKDKKGPFEWIPASEVKKGYYLLFPRVRGTKGYKRVIQISDIVNYKKWKYKIKNGKIFSLKGKHKIQNRIRINEELMRLFGYYCSEGSVDRDAVYFNFGKHEKKYIGDTKKILFNTFNMNPKVKNSNPCASPVYLSSTILSKLFGKLFGKFASKKKLPSWFIFLPNKLLKEFVKGFWRGDGNFNNVGFEFATTSKILSNQLRMILAKLGIISSINVRKIDKNKIRYSVGRKFSYKNDIYRITITGNSIEKMSKILEVDHPFIRQRSKTFSRGKITKNFLWVPVVSVNREKYDGKVFNLKTEAETYALNGFAVHNCTADLGWITGHTYACYGPLSLGATTLIYEGAPDFPDPGRWWSIIQDNGVSVFYTAPTAIRMSIKLGDAWPKKYNLSRLRILGTVGEPIDEESWMWYFKKIGGGRCPVIDTWWQTETGGTLINALPGIGPFIPTVAGRSFPGTRHAVVDEKGRKAKAGENGYLVQLSPFAPGMLRGVFNNDKKYRETYWENSRGKYYTSDGAYADKNGCIRLTGRVDDTMKVAGHRLSTAELENAIGENKKVNECAVVPVPDSIKGQVPIAFVALKKSKPTPGLEKELVKQVEKSIGPIARPSKIYFVDDLPKTRSGKIIRRVLKFLLNKEPLGDLSTLVNPESVEKIRKAIEESH